MRRHLRPVLVVSGLTVLTLVGYTSCQRTHITSSQAYPRSQNTVAGNPLAAEKISNGLCDLIRRCNPGVTSAHCLTGVNATPGVNGPLGLPPSYKTLSAISEGEQSGILTSSISGVDACVTPIAAMDCANVLVAAAYDSASATPFAGAVNLLSHETCGTAVTPSVKYACATKTFLRSATNSPVMPASSSGGATYTVAPALPPGLSLDSQTGIISGTPSSITAQATYAITASSSALSSSTSIRIQTADGFLVDDSGDAVNVGGTACATATGTCTLRAAIGAANSGGLKLIVAPPGTIKISSTLILNSAMEIQGDCDQGTVVDGQNITRVFQVNAGPSTLDHLTIQNGHVNIDAGAGIDIVSTGAPFTTTLRHLVVQANRIDSNANGMADGAGIHVYASGPSAKATVVMEDCVVADNINNNGWYGSGLGLWFDTHADITNSTFSGNQNLLNYGGGLSTRSGSLNISNSTFANNSALTGEGGGIFINHMAQGTANIANVTFYNNRADAGGAIYVGGGTALITNATFVGNRSMSPFYGGALAPMIPVSVQNSIFSDNLANGALLHCMGSGQANSIGHNLSDAVASDCNLNKTGDLTQQIARLGPLQGNGGFTQTMALLPTSPALGGAAPVACPSTDQRGYPRLAGRTCDIGAFEHQ